MYRYAYLIILAAITLGVILARLSYTVILSFNTPNIPLPELSRAINFLDVPKPRAVLQQGIQVKLKFNPFMPVGRKKALNAFLQSLTTTPHIEEPLNFTVTLNEPDKQRHQYMYNILGGRMSLPFSLNPKNIDATISPYYDGQRQRFMCLVKVDSHTQLPNFTVTKATFTGKSEDTYTRLPIRHFVTADNAAHAPLVKWMRLTGSQEVTFLINEAVDLPLQASDNVLLAREQCYTDIINADPNLLVYILFPGLAKTLMGYETQYDLSNTLLKF